MPWLSPRSCETHGAEMDRSFVSRGEFCPGNHKSPELHGGHTGQEGVLAIPSRHPDFGDQRLQPTWSQALASCFSFSLFQVAEASGLPRGSAPGYLETRELPWDWPEEEEVAALSWEKPLVQDSRLDMEPLGGRAQVTLC